MNLRNLPWFVTGLLVVMALAALPLFANAYHLALGISFLYFTVLATAWAMFSGPTRYISLATVAFFGIGAYTVAIAADHMSYPLVLVVAALVGTVIALIVGLSTLRLSGIYFVIFTFGLAELIRQLVTWYEVNIHGSVGRYIFIDVPREAIYWQLLGAHRAGVSGRMADRALAARPRLARDRRGRDRRQTCRHQHHRAPSSSCSRSHRRS